VRGSPRRCADSRYERWKNEYLSKIENEKRHSENLLRNILPAEVVTRLRNGESNIADHFDDATVIVADLVGFSKITARMKAFEIVACLNQLFSEFDKLRRGCWCGERAVCRVRKTCR
jgi:adenylate cyclase